MEALLIRQEKQKKHKDNLKIVVDIDMYSKHRIKIRVPAELLFLYNFKYTLFVNFCVDFIRIVW